jgi:D-lyxose ketol-isomerase
MRRSDINQLIREAEGFFEQFRFKLPPWAHWSPETWQKEGARAATVRRLYLGWDLTDFGGGDYFRRGILLFTIRNGDPAKPDHKNYAEKVIKVRENQETPYHFHWSKMEDIINRGGGTLVLELQQGHRETGETSDEEFTVFIDGVPRRCTPRERVELAPGESITLEPYLYHRFWAEGSAVLVGEVSRVNDDMHDNRFLEPVGRFPEIVEDEEPYRLLVSDYDNAKWSLVG